MGMRIECLRERLQGTEFHLKGVDVYDSGSGWLLGVLHKMGCDEELLFGIWWSDLVERPVKVQRLLDVIYGEGKFEIIDGHVYLFGGKMAPTRHWFSNMRTNALPCLILPDPDVLDDVWSEKNAIA